MSTTRRPKAINEELAKEAVALDDYGFCNDAWPRDAAKRVVENLVGSDVIILGGDVLTNDSTGQLRYTTESWHYDPRKIDREADARASQSVARDYINRYPDVGDRIWFSFVFVE